MQFLRMGLRTDFIFINDLSTKSESELRNFADDAQLGGIINRRGLNYCTEGTG